jgi:acetyl esterase/lipase
MSKSYRLLSLTLIIFLLIAGCENVVVKPASPESENRPSIHSPFEIPRQTTPTPIATPDINLTPTPKPSPVPSTSPSATPTGTPPAVLIQNGYRIVKDVVYGMGGSIPQKLDIYIPNKRIATPTPAVVWIHGGGWSGGDKFPSQVGMLAQNGFLCVSINYRLSGVAQFPAAVEDCKCSIRWLRAHAAEYGIDPDNIGVWGGSAGGHLALMVALVDKSAGLEGTGGWADFSSSVQAVCSFYGSTDMALQFNQGDRNAPSAFLGGRPSEKPDVFKKASPINYVSPDDPPLLMVHGDKDATVPLEQSKLLLDAYQKIGFDARLIVVKNAGHTFQAANNLPVTPDAAERNKEVLDFFSKYLLASK